MLRSRFARYAKRVTVSLRLLAAASVFAGTAALAATPDFPALTGRVVDEAGILSAQTESELIAQLAAHEQATSNQIVVVTLKSLRGYEISDYGYQLGRHWGIGQKGKNNGALLIVAPTERKLRIEVGYGLEGVLTDAVSRDIIERQIKPHLRQQSYEHGIRAGIGAILTALGGGYLRAPPPVSIADRISDSSTNEWPFWLAFMLPFIPLAAIASTRIFAHHLGRHRQRIVYRISAVISLFVGTVMGIAASSIFVGLVFGFIIFVMTMFATFPSPITKSSNRHNNHWWDSTGGGGSNGSSGGGFSGGGGSFGGGGASGDW